MDRTIAALELSLSLLFLFGSSDFGDALELMEVSLVCFSISFGFFPLRVVLLLLLLQVELVGMAILTVRAMEWTLLLSAPLSSTLVSAVELASSWCVWTHSGACKILEGLQSQASLCFKYSHQETNIYSHAAC